MLADLDLLPTDHPTLERHGARNGLRTRIASRFRALAAAIAGNHRLSRPSRSLIDYPA